MTTPSALAPPMNHVFMDFENVHQVDLTLIGSKAVSFTLMVGPKQPKLDSDLVENLMEHSASVRLVKLKSQAKNALDFSLAYYLGRAALADPTANFYIISEDGGYDPLIQHLCDRHINVQRHKSCAELTFTWPGKKAAVSKAVAEEVPAKKVAAKKVPTKTVAKKAAKKEAKKVATKIPDSVEALLKRVVKNLSEHPKARPVRKKTLLTKVADLIKKPADGPEVQRLIDRMVEKGMLSFDAKDVPEYNL